MHNFWSASKLSLSCVKVRNIVGCLHVGLCRHRFEQGQGYCVACTPWTHQTTSVAKDPHSRIMEAFSYRKVLDTHEILNECGAQLARIPIVNFHLKHAICCSVNILAGYG